MLQIWLRGGDMNACPFLVTNVTSNRAYYYHQSDLYTCIRNLSRSAGGWSANFINDTDKGILLLEFSTEDELRNWPIPTEEELRQTYPEFYI